MNFLLGVFYNFEYKVIQLTLIIISKVNSIADSEIKPKKKKKKKSQRRPKSSAYMEKSRSY